MTNNAIPVDTNTESPVEVNVALEEADEELEAYPPVLLVNGGFAEPVQFYTDTYKGKVNVEPDEDLVFDVRPSVVNIGTTSLIEGEETKHLELCVDVRPELREISYPDPIEGVHYIVVLPENTARLVARAFGDLLPSHLAIAYPNPQGAKRNDRSIRYISLVIISSGYELSEILDEELTDGAARSAICHVERGDIPKAWPHA